MEFMIWLESSWLSVTFQSFTWGYPINEALHFVGLCLLMGSIAVMDLRLLGFARELSIKVIHRVLPWAWAGFTINLLTGLYFFISQPTFYFTNTAFQVKMVLILLAGLNALWFQLTVHKDLDNWADDAESPANVKFMAGASLAIWVAVICFGRFIMYWPPF